MVGLEKARLVIPLLLNPDCLYFSSQLTCTVTKEAEASHFICRTVSVTALFFSTKTMENFQIHNSNQIHSK